MRLRLTVSETEALPLLPVRLPMITASRMTVPSDVLPNRMISLNTPPVIWALSLSMTVASNTPPAMVLVSSRETSCWKYPPLITALLSSTGASAYILVTVTSCSIMPSLFSAA